MNRSSSGTATVNSSNATESLHLTSADNRRAMVSPVGATTVSYILLSGSMLLLLL